jgi:hypothetical protein
MRRVTIATAGIAVAGIALVAPSATAAASNNHNGQPHINGQRNVASHARQAVAHTATTAAAAKPATSLGLIGLDNEQTEVLQALSRGLPKQLAAVTDKFGDGIEGTAIDASGTKTLIASDTSAAAWLDGVRTHPKFGGQVNLNAFNGEGGSDYHFYSDGAAIRGDSALVASDSQGVAQLIWKSGGWRVDTRVHFPGRTDAGFARARGFIHFPGSATNYDSVVISPTALRNGKYVGVSVDRDDHTLAVIDGVGTAKPRVALLSDAALGEGSGSFRPDEGSGGVAFSPATPTRAVVTTLDGFAVLNLSNPAKPKLQSLTTVGTPDDAESIGVSADGSHVAEAVADTVYTYSGLLTTSAGSPLSPVSMINPGDVAGFIFDVNYLVGGQLAVVHGDSTSGYRLDMYEHATTSTPTIESGVKLVAEPEDSNSLSVWPSNTTPALRPAGLLHGARVGKHVKQRLSVAGGIGHYSFAVTGGKLPKGVSRHGATISGTPKQAGTFHFTITAASQYGEGVLRSYTVTVKKKK